MGKGVALDDSVRRDIVALLPRLRRFAYGLTGSVEEGDDLVQSACERALSRLHLWEAGTRLDSWMYRIVQNVWIDRRRAARNREAATEMAVLEMIPGGDARPELEHRLELAEVRRQVAALPEEQRAVLLLVCVEGASYREAADILRIPIGTVMSRLARARLSLGRAMGERPAGPRLVTGGRG
jgi:RNA polymerase sigma-70 factor (ECF subfamily)